MQLILGTANACSKYSINQHKKVDKNNLIQILKFANKNKIKTFDTAPKYKNAEKILGNLNFSKVNIITKISSASNKDLKVNILKEVLKSKKKLKVKKLYCLLIHDINFFKKKNSKEIARIISEIKKDGIVKKIGFSVYDPKDIDFILKHIKPDLVQIPLSLFDRRFIVTKKIKKLHSLGIEIHVRSIFMKGLLLASDNKILRKFSRFEFFLEKFDKWCNKNRITKLQAAINFIKTVKNIDGVVVGVDSVDQLKNIIYAFKNSSKKYPKKIHSQILKKYLDIRKWKI
jgi:aryl-alcohol dehydrogenase-like predicted oxidoreductase